MMTPTTLATTRQHMDMANYSASTLQTLVPSLVETLMVEQPRDPIAFLRAHLDSLSPTRSAPAAVHRAPADDEEMEGLRAEVERLRSENTRLRMAQRPAGERECRLVAAQWNLAGVNQNPFEFAAPRDDRFPRVEAFVAAVDSRIGQVLSAVDHEHEHEHEHEHHTETPRPPAVTEPQALQLREMTLSELLTGLSAAASNAPSGPEETPDPAPTEVPGSAAARSLTSEELQFASGLVDAAASTPPQLLDFVQRGLSSSVFSTPDLKLKDRGWTLINCRPESTRSFLSACCSCFGHTAEAGEDVWWKQWISSVYEAAPASLRPALATTALPLAVFDVLLAKIAGDVVSRLEATDRSALIDELIAYVRSMNTTPEAKAKALASSFQWTLSSYGPSLIGLEEFNEGWLTEPSFKQFWEKCVAGEDAEGGGFDVVRPRDAATKGNPMQQTLLLVRKGDDSPLVMDAERTQQLSAYLGSEDMSARLRQAFASLFAPHVVEAQLEAAERFLERKFAAAVCTLRTAGGAPLGEVPVLETVLVVAAHAASNGTDNRAIVTAAKQLALWLGQGMTRPARLVLMMDANSAAAFPRKNMDRGAATQEIFRGFLQNDATLSSCWHDEDQEEVHHSVMKERTHLQTQWKKAGLLDMALKDWIVHSADSARSNSVAINCFGTPEFAPLPAALWSTDDTEVRLGRPPASLALASRALRDAGGLGGGRVHAGALVCVRPRDGCGRGGVCGADALARSAGATRGAKRGAGVRRRLR